MYHGDKILDQYQNRVIRSPEERGPQADFQKQNGDVSQIPHQDEHLQSNDDIGALVKDLQI